MPCDARSAATAFRVQKPRGRMRHCASSLRNIVDWMPNFSATWSPKLRKVLRSQTRARAVALDRVLQSPLPRTPVPAVDIFTNGLAVLEDHSHAFEKLPAPRLRTRRLRWSNDRWSMTGARDRHMRRTGICQKSGGQYGNHLDGVSPKAELTRWWTAKQPKRLFSASVFSQPSGIEGVKPRSADLT